MKATNLITTQRQRNKIRSLFFNSNIRSSSPDLVIQTDFYTDKNTVFSIGIYHFNSITGVSYVEKITHDMDYLEMRLFLELN